MMYVISVIGSLALLGFLILLYALCKVSQQADYEAKYNEEYSKNLDFYEEDQDVE